jgi:2-amino-4-hydroxy-6-hydroxymethyldihydropteridine diphosphokinase/dihydropteroate synthase
MAHSRLTGLARLASVWSLSRAPVSRATFATSSLQVDLEPKLEEVVIALGSNIGDRLNNFSRALELLRRAGIRVTGHGCLYESAPAYVTDQPVFLNSCIKASTSLEPHALLRTLKNIEKELGRTEGGIRYGPRPLDLDIIFYGSSTVNSDLLQIPHPRLKERPFVLAPVVDLLKADSATGSDGHWSSHPYLGGGLLEVWRENGGEESVGKQGLKRVTQIGSKLWDWGEKTHIMGILNVTPDSFCDGGLYMNVDSALAQARRMVSEGADFIDVGAQSTRPGAERLTTEKELDRLLPVLDALVKADDLQDVCFSVDTFDSRVVEEAVARGVHLVNDVSAG